MVMELFINTPMFPETENTEMSLCGRVMGTIPCSNRVQSNR